MAVKLAETSQCNWLCNTGHRIDGYGTIDLGEMAIVQWAMVESVSPGDQKFTRKKLEAPQFLSAFSHSACRLLEHCGMGMNATLTLGSMILSIHPEMLPASVLRLIVWLPEFRIPWRLRFNRQPELP